MHTIPPSLNTIASLVSIGDVAYLDATSYLLTSKGRGGIRKGGNMSEITKIIKALRKQGYKNFIIWKGYAPDLSRYYAEEVIEKEGQLYYKQIHLSGWQAHPIPEILHIQGELGKRGYNELMAEIGKEE